MRYAVLLALASLATGDVITLAEYWSRRTVIEGNDDLLSYELDEALLEMQADTIIVTARVVDIGANLGPPKVYQVLLKDEEADQTWVVDFDAATEDFIRSLRADDILKFRASFGTTPGPRSSPRIYPDGILTEQEVQYYTERTTSIQAEPEGPDLDAIKADVKRRVKSWLKDRKRLPCNDCDADGIETCGKCDGSGRLKVINLGGGSGYKVCTRCNGARGFQCGDCDGTGLDSGEVGDAEREWGWVPYPVRLYKTGSIEVTTDGVNATVQYEAKIFGDDEYRTYETQWQLRDGDWMPILDNSRP